MKKRFIAVGLILLMAILLPAAVSAETIEIGSPEKITLDEAYSYPVTPADEEWSNFTTTKEMYNACQIPEKILSRLSTEALLESVLNYPLLGNYRCYDDYQKAAKYLCKNFNGLEELMNRDDLTEVLFARYSDTPVLTAEDLKDNNNMRLGYVNTFFEDDNLEFLIAYDQIVNGNYTSREMKELNKLLDEKVQLRKSEEDIYSNPGGTYSDFLYQVSQNEIMAGENVSVTTVTTPNGTSVQVYVRTPDFTTSEKTSMDNEIASLYPNATKIRTATIKYNCHSYAWYSQSTSNNYWMNDPSAYFTDGSYITTPFRLVGLKGCNLTKTHSVVISELSSLGEVSKVKSKWGEYGLYEHSPDYSPYDPVFSYYYG